MVTAEQIRNSLFDSLRQLPGTILGEVRDVDRQNRTCTVDNDGVEIHGVRLQCVTGSDKGIVPYPKVGTMALIIRIEESDDYCLALAAEFDQYDIAVEDRCISMTKDGVVFNNGSLGLVKIDKMLEWMDKVHSDLQTLATLLSTSPIAGNGAPAAITFTPSTPNPVRAEFEDNLVKH